VQELDVLDNGLNTLRAVLVGLAVVAALILAFNGAWLATGVLSVGIVAHGLMWLYLWRQSDRTEPTQPVL
jgi:hypothetical protein